MLLWVDLLSWPLALTCCCDSEAHKMGEMDIVLSLEDWGSIDLQQVVTKDRTTQVSAATLWVSRIHYRKVANLFTVWHVKASSYIAQYPVLRTAQSAFTLYFPDSKWHVNHLKVQRVCACVCVWVCMHVCVGGCLCVRAWVDVWVCDMVCWDV